MKMKMNYYFGIMILVVCVALSGGGGGGVGVCRAQQSLAEQCSAQLPQVMTCVAFASGKETTPQQKCCDSVKGMKESNPACLCFLIQQIHNGTNPALQKMNIQEAHLLQLPSACNIANASITDCPKLLNLPPNSPDAAIFNNVTSTATPTTTTGSTTPSQGFKHEATPTLLVILMLSVLLFSISFTYGL